MTTTTVKAAIEYLVDQKEISRNLLHYPDEIALLISFLELEGMVSSCEGEGEPEKVTKDS